MRQKIKSKQRIPYPLIVIACEGQTEKNYFDEIKCILKSINPKINIDVISGEKSDCLSVVELAKKYDAEYECSQIFCVFDRDSKSNTEEKIKQACEKAKEIENTEIIFSNPTFETWLLAHYKDIGYTNANNLKRELKKSEKLGSKFKCDTAKNYKKLRDKTQKASKRAEALAKQNQRNKIDKFSDDGNPSTDVYKIINYLQDLYKITL